ncbi:asparagine synthase-domain-containing protein [Bombardia bombarda]|uniref:Asparagine synthase-domain-containing protein n=1 Tax=Bombardia bombarda TaxID=252184 RepID=A0AA40CFJ0_9PEZI|nr:asparagine synthase-domain-containing protein [Bombardia bombarda]
MCGIHAVLSATAHTPSTELKHRLVNRGPDYLGQVERRVGSGSGSGSDSARTLTFTSTVLALRGDHVARQPLVDANGSVLCWNGEAWRIDGENVEGNDGEAIFGMLMKASASSTTAGKDAILDVFRAIEGPFAFVYYDKPSEALFYGRDRLGRRSLMIAALEDSDVASSGAPALILSSIAEACTPNWKEVEADGIYALDLVGSGTGNVQQSESGATIQGLQLPAKKHEWLAAGGDHADFVSSIGRFNKSLPAAAYVLTSLSPSVAMLKQQLLNSLRPRVLNIPQPPPLSSSSVDETVTTRVAVLFSGGLDCTVLARLVHEILEPEQGIDLINVAFENPRVVAQLEKSAAKGEVADFYEACPDRITGRRSFAELEKVCLGRKFRFIAVNVPYSETVAHRGQVISLIYPHNTEMDLSIAYALYFAARGQGVCTEISSDGSEEKVPYMTPSRVLLSGLGADELFGGYSRHPAAFTRQGYAGLVDELLLDVGRLGKRNLGRDDRAMSHWSKEVRFPYLDERLVRWAIETAAWEKCDFENGEEVTSVEAGKRVLRLVALELGLENVAKEKKRAIQFGARTAKMESGRVKGTTLIS